MGEHRRRWSADHRWQHPGAFCTRAGAAAVRDSGARSMKDALEHPARVCARIDQRQELACSSGGTLGTPPARSRG